MARAFKPTMVKAPPNIPTAAGQKVRLRANKNRTAVVAEITPRGWCIMQYPESDKLQVPKMMHPFELELLPIDSSVKTAV